MKKVIIFVLIILTVGILAFAVWKSGFLNTKSSGMFIMESGKKRMLSSKESSIIQKQVPVIPSADTTYKTSNVSDPELRKNLETINQVQKINEMNKKQNK